MSEPNDLLRFARERAPSPTSPGEPLTRQELADLVNAHIYRVTGRVTAVDANHVGKWERGVIRWPAAHYRAALRAVLDAPSDADLGFTNPRRANLDRVNRKTFLKSAFGVGAGAFVLRPGEAHALPAGDTRSAIGGPTACYRRMESTVSSEYLGPAVAAHLRLSYALVAEQARTPSGFGLLAEIAGLAAWLSADRGDSATARRRYAEAIGYAQQAAHPLLAGYMTASLGQFAVDGGYPRQGLRLLDRAVTQLGASAPDSAHAWLASLRAVAHAALGERLPSIAALKDAERLTGRARGEPVWPWVFSFDSAKAARYQAAALGRLGDVRAARAAYQAASPALTAPKPRALAQVEHAHVLAGDGHVAEACALAAEALATGQAYGSERVAMRVRNFRATLPFRTAEARELDAALQAIYDTGAP
ncbi:hypothetical protein [Gandjariella thermophila]|uniref:Transcriptional regulator n=1 Tax=Gandjariella thermophila TaxID=1931992 RepID=A0A4D4J031_9PSEU|nr:hypothetical protein [Gandjariella thermophila]GDY28422.1 hypothetical protein GTS_00550 [Gandjariella thermophila]